MTLQQFVDSLRDDRPPTGLSPLLQAMWHERNDNWTRAHDIAQDLPTSAASWVHAYLHRREGDPSNAAYWYRQAQRSIEHGDLDREWEAIVSALLRDDGETRT